MRSVRFFAIICSILILLSACKSSALSSDKELYDAGLDLISIMEEMLKSEEYLSILGTDGFESITEVFKSYDYDSPSAVYSLSFPETTDVLQASDNFDPDAWNSLSESLKKQLESRMSISAVINIINGSYGIDHMAFSSVYTASDQSDALELDSDKAFLYTFEENASVMISYYTNGAIQGQFIFLEGNKTLSEIRKIFKEFGCSVNKVEID